MIKALQRKPINKRCPCCGDRKDISEFGISLNPCSTTGRMSSCKSCEFEASVKKVALNTIADEKRAKRKVEKEFRKKIAPALAIEKRYNRAIQDFIRIFEEKQEIEFTMWANGEVGTIAFFNRDYAFDFTDIKFDLLTNKDIGLIIEYYEWENDEETLSYDGWYEVYINKKEENGN